MSSSQQDEIWIALEKNLTKQRKALIKENESLQTIVSELNKVSKQIGTEFEKRQNAKHLLVVSNQHIKIIINESAYSLWNISATINNCTEIPLI